MEVFDHLLSVNKWLIELLEIELFGHWTVCIYSII